MYNFINNHLLCIYIYIYFAYLCKASHQRLEMKPILLERGFIIEEHIYKLYSALVFNR